MGDCEDLDCAICGVSLKRKLSKARYHSSFGVVLCRKCSKLAATARWLFAPNATSGPLTCAFCGKTKLDHQNLHFLRCAGKNGRCKLTYCDSCVFRLSACVETSDLASSADEPVLNLVWDCFLCDSKQLRCRRFSVQEFVELRSGRNHIKRKRSQFSKVPEDQFPTISDFTLDDDTAATIRDLLSVRVGSEAIAHAARSQALCVAPAQHSRDTPSDHVNVAPPPYVPAPPPPYSAPAPPGGPPPPFAVQPPPGASAFGPLYSGIPMFGSLPPGSDSGPSRPPPPNSLARAFQANPYAAALLCGQNPTSNTQYSMGGSAIPFPSQYAGNVPYGVHANGSRHHNMLPNAQHTPNGTNQHTIRPEQAIFVARGALKRCESLTNRLSEFASLNSASIMQAASLCATLSEFLRHFANLEELEQLGRFETPRSGPVPMNIPGAPLVVTSRPAARPASQAQAAPVATVTTASGLSVSVASEEVQLAGVKLDWDREVGAMTVGQLVHLPNAARLRSLLERFAQISAQRYGNRITDIALSPRSRRDAQKVRERAVSAPPSSHELVNLPCQAAAAVPVTVPTTQTNVVSNGAVPEQTPAQNVVAVAANTDGHLRSAAPQTTSTAPAKHTRIGTMSKLMSPRKAAAAAAATAALRSSTLQNAATQNSNQGDQPARSFSHKNYCIPKVKPGSGKANEAAKNAAARISAAKDAARQNKQNGVPEKPHKKNSENDGPTDKDRAKEKEKKKHNEKEKEKEKEKEQSTTNGETAKDGVLKLKIKKPPALQTQTQSLAGKDTALPKLKVKLDKSKVPFANGPQRFLTSSDSDSEQEDAVRNRQIKRRRVQSSSSSSSLSSDGSLSDNSNTVGQDRETELRLQRELQQRLEKETAERRERERASNLANQSRRCVERPPGGQIRFKKGTFKQNSRCSVALLDVANLEPCIFMSKTIDFAKWRQLSTAASFVPPAGGIRIPLRPCTEDVVPQVVSNVVDDEPDVRASPARTTRSKVANATQSRSQTDCAVPKSNGAAVEPRRGRAAVKTREVHTRLSEDDEDPFKEISRALNKDKRPRKGRHTRQRAPSQDDSSRYGTPNGSDVDQLDGKNDKRTPTRRGNARLASPFAALRAELNNCADTDSHNSASEAHESDETGSQSDLDHSELLYQSEQDDPAAPIEESAVTLPRDNTPVLPLSPSNDAAVSRENSDKEDEDGDGDVQALLAEMDDSDNSDDERPAGKAKRVNTKRLPSEQAEEMETLEDEADPDETIAADQTAGTDGDAEETADEQDTQEPSGRRKSALNINIGKVPLAPPLGLPKRKGSGSQRRIKAASTSQGIVTEDELYDDDVPIEEDESDGDPHADLDLHSTQSQSTDGANKTNELKFARAGKQKAARNDSEIIDLLSDEEQVRALTDDTTKPKNTKRTATQKRTRTRPGLRNNANMPNDDDSDAQSNDSERIAAKAKKRLRCLDSDSDASEVEIESQEEDDDDDEVVLISSDSELAQLTKPPSEPEIETDAAADAESTTKPKLRRVVMEDEAAEMGEEAENEEESAEKEDEAAEKEDSDFEQKPKRRTRSRANAKESKEDRKKRLEDLRNTRMKKLADTLLDGNETGGRVDATEEAEDTALLGLYRTSKSDKQKLLSISKEHRLVEQAERERIERIRERQRIYNEVHTANRDAQDRLTRLILEKDTDPPVEVTSCLIRRLKEHQSRVIEFMYSNLYVSLEHSRKDTVGSGCIVAHCMGLGKTLSVISFLHTILTRPELYGARTALILSPYNTINNWEDEWRKWLKAEENEEQPSPVKVINLHSRANRANLAERVPILQRWHTNGHIMICSYDTFRNLVLPQGGRNCKSKRKQVHAKSIPASVTSAIERFLCDPGPDLVVCDEGHVMKNVESAIAESVFKIRTRRRIVLTGTPLQNHLKEYHCMVSFCKENLLGPLPFFRYQFVQPITAGQHKDSTEWQVKLMKKRAHVLNQKLKSCIDRRDVDELKRFLPAKFEYTIYLRYSRLQCELYQHYLKKYPPPKQAPDVFDENARRNGQKKLQSTRLFADHRRLMLVNAHPYALHLSSVRLAERKPLDDFIASDTEESEVDSEDGDSGARKKRRGRPGKSQVRATNGAGEEEEEVEDEKVDPNWWKEVVHEPTEIKFQSLLSGKFVLLLDLIRMCEEIGDKLLVFSQSLVTLDLIELFLENVAAQGWLNLRPANGDQPTSSNAHGSTSWDWEEDYLRIDGATDADTRKRYVDRFNDSNDPRCRLFLISVKAGGLGINLCAANRIVLFDVSWNPAIDAQALFRSYRLGQTKPVYVYRLVSEATMEHKIYNRCIVKASLAKRVVDAHQIERYYTQADLQELYNYDPDLVDDVQLDQSLSWAVPKDRMLGELLSTRPSWIVRYQEHESLLENRVEEDLTEEERAQAWREFEDERKQDKQKSVASRIADACRLAAQGLPFDVNTLPEAAPFVNTVRHVRQTLIQNPGTLAYDRIVLMLRTPTEKSPPLEDTLSRLIATILMSNLSTRNLSAAAAAAANAGGLARMNPLLASSNAAISGSAAANLAAMWANRAHPDRAAFLSELDRQAALEMALSNSGTGAVNTGAANASGRLMMQQAGNVRRILLPSRARPPSNPTTQNQATAAASAAALGSNDEATAIEISDDNEGDSHSSSQPSPEADVVAVQNGTESIRA